MGRDHRWIEEPNPSSPTALLPCGPDPTHLHHHLGLASRAYLVPVEIVHGPGSLELLGNSKKQVRWGGQSRKEKGVGSVAGLSAGVPPGTLISSTFMPKEKWRQLRSLLGEGSATSLATAWIPHHTPVLTLTPL